MKKVISLALISSVLALPTAVFAAGDASGGPYKNKGQCESGLANARNDVRKDIKDVIPPNEVNAIVRELVKCVQNPDGTWSWGPA